MRETRLSRLMLATPLLALCACQTKETEKQPVPSNRLPTATEVFDLRSKCAALAEKIMDDNLIGSALAQEQLSHYSPYTNRCYVKLHVHTADLATPQDRFISESYLYDGQTKELLATTSWNGGKKSGQIFSDSLRGFAKYPAVPTYEETDSMIEKFMAEERKP